MESSCRPPTRNPSLPPLPAWPTRSCVKRWARPGFGARWANSPSKRWKTGTTPSTAQSSGVDAESAEQTTALKTLVITSIYPSPGLPTAGPYNFQTFRPLMNHCELKVVSPLPCWSRIHRPSELFGAPWVDVDGIPSCYPTYWSIPRAPAMHARALYHSLKGSVGRLRQDFPFDVILATWAYPDTVAAAM